MAALPENDRLAGPYIAAAGQRDFAADFPLIKGQGVYAQIERGGAVINLRGAQVEAVDPSESGFTCRLAEPANEGDRVWIFSLLPTERDRSHTPNGSVRTRTLEDDAEELQAQHQEARRDLGRAIVAPFGEAGLQLPPRAVRAGRTRVLGSNPEGDVTLLDGSLFKGDPGGTTDLIGTLQAARQMVIKSEFEAVRTTGYSTPGDGGGALYRRAWSAPTHAGKFQSADGQWWGISEPSIFVEQFGAKGDGVADDYPAIQAAHDYLLSQGGGDLMFRARTYRLSQALEVRSEGSYYQKNPVVNLYGQGARTILTRNMTSAADVPDIHNEAACRSGAAIALYCSNAIIDGLAFEDAGVGLYIGQDPTSPALTNASMNRLRNIWVRNCGVGLIGFVAENAYYSGFSDWHITQCKYGVVMDWHGGSPIAGSVANFNRNHLRNIRISRCWVGMWNKSGGTLTFTGLHFEGNSKTPPTDNRYSAPNDVPAPLLGKAGALIIGPKAGGNWHSGIFENNDFDIYNEGIHNFFEGDIDGAKCTWIAAPSKFLIPEASVWALVGSSGVASIKAAPQDNARIYGSVTVPAGVDYTLALRGSELHAQERGRRMYMDPARGVEAVRVVRLGQFSANQIKSGIVIQSASDFLEPYMRNNAGALHCTIVGRDLSNRQGYLTDFKIIYTKTSARAGDYIFTGWVVGGAATGAPGGGGEDAELWRDIRAYFGGANNRDILLELRTPQDRAVAEASVFIRDFAIKDVAMV